MKAVAFAPGHISGFFEPVYHPEDLSRSGSRGAGINVSLGAISEVSIEPSDSQSFEIFINAKKSQAPVTKLALKYLLGENPFKVVVKTKLDLPMGQGFGMSAAGSLSATLAATKITNLSRADAIKAAHCAEVQLRTGLGDVMASSFGGLEIRKSPGLPPWGLIEHIPCKHQIILCVMGKKIDTKKILTDSSKINKIAEYGKYCTKKILEKPSVEKFFELSLIFTKKTSIANKRILEILNNVNKHAPASMCMLGNSIFTLGNEDKIIKYLTSLGKTYICNIEEFGARTID